jgi:hypothetical protein
MSDRDHLDNPLPDLDTLLRDAAAGAQHQTLVPSYDTVAGVARRRRTTRFAAQGLFAAVLGVTIGVGVVAGVDRGSDPSPPAASAPAVDPALQPYRTKIPILTWTPVAGAAHTTVSGTAAFRTAVFSALGAGDHDFGHVADLRAQFPDAPVGGPAIAIDQSTTRAQLERAAANLRELDGVQDAKVVEVTGLWFTVSAVAPAEVTGGKPERAPAMDLNGLKVGGSAGGQKRDATGTWMNTVRTTYVGPPISTADFDLIRRRAAEAVRVDVSKVVVTAESAAPRPARS